MKSLKTFFILSLFFQSALYSQYEVSPPREVYFDFHAATLDLCDNTKHVYLEFYKDSYYGTNQNVESEIESIEVYPTRDPSKRHVLKNVNEVEFFNLNSVDNQIPFTILAFNSKNEKLFQNQIYVNTRKEKGIVDVSDKLDKQLDGFVGSKSSLITYFCGKEISKVELLAFFQDFLQLSPETICELIAIHNQVLGTPFENWQSLDDGSILATILTCYLLEVYQNKITGGNGGSTGGDGNECACNLIRTKSSALNVGTLSQTTNPTEDCEFYQPRTIGKNYDPDGADGDDDLILSYGRFGAAKAATVELFYDGSDDSPDWEVGLNRDGAL